MKNAIWENVFRRKKKDLSETAYALSKVPIFESLSKRELREIENIIHKREYSAGETIFGKGDPGLGMYIIISGKVQIVDNSDPENIIIYSELTNGDFFGDLALVDDSDRSAAAITSDETRMISFFRPELKDIMTRFPKIGNKLLLSLAGVIGMRLRKSNEYMQEVQQKLHDLEDHKAAETE